MEFQSSYISRPVDENGDTEYNEEENQVWSELITRQLPIVQTHACPEYCFGLELLNLSQDKIPQCREISEVLQASTGWSLEPVPALIPVEHFFRLLSERKFPAATFIRRRSEIDYLQEPDIFHEIFGHCPLLTNHAYADFTHAYGRLGLSATDEERILLARLYWFTIEFGLMKSPAGVRAYGGGILSSMNETIYCLESPLAKRKAFDVLEALRTPYRIDIMQPVYFVIDDFNVLFELIEMDLIGLVHQAMALGMFKPEYTE